MKKNNNEVANTSQPWFITDQIRKLLQSLYIGGEDVTL